MATLCLAELCLAGCVSTGPDVQARDDAAALARSDVGIVAQGWDAAVTKALAAGQSEAAAGAAGRRAALSEPVPYLSLLDTTPTPHVPGSKITQPIAVVRQATSTEGIVSTTRTVRVCALLAAPTGSSEAQTGSSLTCPTTLPTSVPGLGTVTDTVAYTG